MTEARLWGKRFVEWYNKEHRYSGIQYVTPEERHTGKDKEVLEQRKRVYEEARKNIQKEWVKEIRDWSFSEEEWLNPKQEKETKTEEKAS